MLCLPWLLGETFLYGFPWELGGWQLGSNASISKALGSTSMRHFGVPWAGPPRHHTVTVFVLQASCGSRSSWAQAAVPALCWCAASAFSPTVQNQTG